MVTNRFGSYEEQMSYFTDTTNIKILPMTEGRGAFFSQLGSWFQDWNNDPSSGQVSYILPNPAQSLSFPTPIDVLSAVMAIYQNSNTLNDNAVDLLVEFGLSSEKASQPIVSLSGGELLLLSYAKAKAMLPIVNRLVACSPLHWLNRNRYRYWELLVSCYKKKQKNVDVALLDGEPFPDKAESTDSSYWHNADIRGLEWSLGMQRPKIVFPEVKFPTYHPGSSLEYISRCKCKRLRLGSPTLITGDNGIGKSIFAKILAGVIKPVSGSVSIFSPNGRGNARLIFQDAIDQLFGMSIDAHMNWVFRFDSNKAEVAQAVYSAIENNIRSTFQNNYFPGLAALGAATRRTLLQTKIGLVAERIASQPPLIVFDEPGWGLSKSVSRIFIVEACKLAHEKGVAVMIISHQPKWWEDLVASHIHLEKDNNDKVLVTVL